MFSEKIPSDLKNVPVIVLDNSGLKYPGMAAIKVWTPQEAFCRGFKKSLKIVRVLLLLPLPFVFLEPFAFMIWGSLSLAGAFFLAGPFLHVYYWSESTSFFFVDAECPYCHTVGKLQPFIGTAFNETFTVLCPECGQSSQAAQTVRSD